MAINTTLEDLYFADKEERESIDGSNENDLQLLATHDKQRLTQLTEILPQVDINEIWNCHYLAYLLQHGETTEDYEKAHFYAKKAVDMGSNVTKWLYAATKDRLLISQGKVQKFGTQFEKVDGQWRHMPVNPNTTDTERAKYGVPPLAEALQRFKDKYSKKKDK